MTVFSQLYNDLVATWLGPWCAMLMYASAAVMQWRLWRVRATRIRYTLVVSVLAVVLHGLLLHHWIDVGGLQNLSAANLFSLLCWSMAVTLLLMAWRPYVLCLSVLLYPLAVVSIIWVLCDPGQHWVMTVGDHAMLWHILLAIMVVTMLALSALMALLMAWQERRIRSHQLGVFDRHLPSLVLVEQHVFQMMCVGFSLLSVMLLMSAYHYGWLLWSSAGVRYKVVLVLLAWLVFAGALLARWALGYRGRNVVYMTLVGVALLLMVYMGT
jgi:ABC-type uncharacterized transport system permease subunit